MTDNTKLTGAEDVIWDLSHLYTSDDDPAFEADMQKADQLADTFAANYRGKVAELDAEELMDAIKTEETLDDIMGRLYSFASLRYATDTADPANGALVQKMSEFGSQIGQKTVFFGLEWNNLDDEKVSTLLSNPILRDYHHHLESSRRYKPYQLNEEQEQILIEKDVTGRSAWTRFFTQLTSAMRYELDGDILNQSQLLKKLQDNNRDLRKRAADALTKGLREKSMELAYIFNVLAADKATDDRLRGYETWVSSRNLSNKAPDSVVEALVEAVTSRYDLVSRHYNLKRILLDLDELTDYDRYAPVQIKESEKFYTWDEAKAIVLKAFNAFSPRMGEVAQRFFDENWIHAPVLDNKQGGAFASPVTPSVHPYILVNYLGKPSDVSTLAHELGHGIHMVLSGEESGIFGLYTPLTTAEMASTFAEMLVFTDLLAQEDDPAVRLSMLVEKVEDSFGTVFRQTAMNRFEDGMHTARRTEGELTHERISEIWLNTQKDMFGDSVNLRNDYGAWWSYVPHFLHTPGYVYAYAFGELLVLALYNVYKEQGESFVPKYIDVLAAGNSDYPDKILAKVDVDLNDPAFWHKGLDAIAALIEQEEALAKEIYPDRF